MRLKQLVDNRNLNLHPLGSEYLNIHNNNGILSDVANKSVNQTDILLFNSNCDRESCEIESIDNVSNVDTNVNKDCHRTDNNGLLNLHPENTQTSNLEGTTQTHLAVHESFLDTTDALFNPSPFEDESGFEQSDTDEMSEVSSHPVHPVPRGIVNPNYPGFQHLAHTLQDYSTNIDTYYHSENDMTDDDVDIADITELNYDEKECIGNKNINNNILSETILPTNDIVLRPLDIPDLLKCISDNSNNNIISREYEASNPDPDVENNFLTKDIIGNFNKEIEDEIRLLLNYNIKIQSDLEELRNDIKVNLAKPIENTINNITEVVNHVIKKLVETQIDICDKNDQIDVCKYNTARQPVVECFGNLNEKDENNTSTEINKMNITRPTFLYIDNIKNIAPDAYLSDGAEEFNIDEDSIYTKLLSDEAKTTVQKLSTELKPSVEILDESRGMEFYNAEETETDAVITDENSNRIKQPNKQLTTCCTQPRAIELTEKASAYNNREHVVASEPGKTKKLQSDDFKNEAKSTKTSSIRNTKSTRDMDLESFDVYNIETALPKLDFDAIERHLKAAKEAERRKHNDREEIRRRLATGVDSEEYHSLGHGDRPGRKPSLQSRLQNGKNLQICYMNENASDNESQTSDVEINVNSSKNLSRTDIFRKNNFNHPYQTRPLSVDITKQDKLNTVESGLKLRPPLISKSKSRSSQSLSQIELRESDFHAMQATLQTEARIALAQAKEMARVQMECERRSQSVSPVTEMLRRSMEKAHAPLAADRRRVSRQLLTDMNVAQLQVIVNELHSQIEALNESLVRLLMARDELHMGQDSMLVDIEDLTRYLGVKEQTKKTKGSKSGVKRLTSFVHK